MKTHRETKVADHYDIVIIGAGLAGLSLARQLLLTTDKKILLVDKRTEIPPPRQKVGESTVQLSGYYYSKVLDLEEHLLREHFMKYNLRYYWKTAGRKNDCFEDYGKAYIRAPSNIASYQLDRNKFEAEMLRLNRLNPAFRFYAPVTDLQVKLSDEGPHSVCFKRDGNRVVSTETDWVVDTSGRGKFLARRMELARRNPIRHGASFAWVEGLVDIDKLTALSPKEIRLKKERRATGHLPVWLATNHFCGEGFWFWVIPLQGKTSLGLVYDNRLFPGERVSTPQRLIEWACQEFPLFARDLPYRTILDYSSFKDFSYDCVQTISSSRWALSGEAGRFTDPLYSPGSDLISVHNTLIVDAIQTRDASQLTVKCRIYEQLMRSLYQASVPTYAFSYDALGDQEAFSLKYTWELSVYFVFYVFPFINDLFTDGEFIVPFLSRFCLLGPVNRNLQSFISSYYQWKKTARQPLRKPLLNDFMEVGPLRSAGKTFYCVGVSAGEAIDILDSQLKNLRELALYIVAHITSVVLSDERVVTNREFIESITLDDLRFDPDEMRECYAECACSEQSYEWGFDPHVLDQFRTEPLAVYAEATVDNVGKGAVL